MFGIGEDRDEPREQQYRGEGGNRLPPMGGNVTHGGGYPPNAGVYNDDDDFRGAADSASRHAGSSGDSSIFGSILQTLSQKKGQLADEDVDEDEAVRSHKKHFGGEDEEEETNSKSMGSAAAMQALKMFSGGQSGGSQGQNQFVAMAMAEASKLFDQKASQGKVSGGSSKESAIQQAGEVALKMYMKSQGSGSSGSSSVSGLMGLASKFL